MLNTHSLVALIRRKSREDFAESEEYGLEGLDGAKKKSQVVKISSPNECQDS